MEKDSSMKNWKGKLDEIKFEFDHCYLGLVSHKLE
jgi:hypothetical protein